MPGNTITPTTTIPQYSIGSPGDRANTVAFDGTYYYYSTGDYNGTSAIWYRFAKSSGIVMPSPPPPPAIPTLTISSTVSSNEKCSATTCVSKPTANLNWKTTDATLVTINGDVVSSSGNKTFGSGITAILQFHVEGLLGTIDKSYTVKVPASSTYKPEMTKPGKQDDRK